MPAAVSVEVLGESDFGAWARLVAESPDGSIYSLPEYLAVLCRCAGGRFRLPAAIGAKLAAPRPTLVEVVLEDSAALHLDRARGLAQSMARRALPAQTLRRLRRRVRGSR